MNPQAFGNSHSPTILIVQNNIKKIEFDSSILTLFNMVYLSRNEDTNILSWIQQNQPDLIILEFENHEQVCSSLITPLKLDWLTRDIPIIATGNLFTLQSLVNLGCDASLKIPYSVVNLEKTIFSLVEISFFSVHYTI